MALALVVLAATMPGLLIQAPAFAQGRPTPNLPHHSPDFDPFSEHAPVVSGAHTASPPTGPVISRPLLQNTARAVTIPATASDISAVASPAALVPVVDQNSKPVKASISHYQPRSRSPRSQGEAVLPMMVHMAMRPELIDATYLKMILGASDNKGVSAFGMSSLHWTAKELGGPVYALQNGVASFSQKHNGPSCMQTYVQKTFLVQFRRSGMQLKHLKKQLGEPLRSYYDDNCQPVEEFQFTPNAVLTFTEPHNCFDISRMAVIYNGPQLAPPTAQDYAVASQYRLGAARKFLASGNTVRCAELLNEHLKQNPEDAGAHLILARTYRHYGDINASMTEYRRAFELARKYHNTTVEKDAYEGLTQYGVTQTTISGRKTASKISHSH